MNKTITNARSPRHYIPRDDKQDLLNQGLTRFYNLAYDSMFLSAKGELCYDMERTYLGQAGIA